MLTYIIYFSVFAILAFVLSIAVKAIKGVGLNKFKRGKI